MDKVRSCFSVLIKGLAKSWCTNFHLQSHIWVISGVIFGYLGAAGDDDDLPPLIPASMLKKTPAPTPFPAPSSASAHKASPTTATGSSTKGSSASSKPRTYPVKTSLTPPHTHTM